MPQPEGVGMKLGGGPEGTPASPQGFAVTVAGLPSALDEHDAVDSPKLLALAVTVD